MSEDWTKKIGDLMHNQEYAQALEEMEKIENSDDLDFIKAIAYYRQNEFDAAKEQLLKITSGPWHDKARFLLANVYSSTKDFEKAQNIYMNEAVRLRSLERREEIARIYIKFAEELSREPKNDLDKKPDYKKANFFYQEALKLQLSESLSEELSFKIAITYTKALDWHNATRIFAEHKSKYANGKYYNDACYQYALLLLIQKDFSRSREAFKDVIKDLDTEGEIYHDCMWQITRTYDIPKTGANQVNFALDSLANYLEKFSNGEHSVQAAYEISQLYLAHKQIVEAITALRLFLAGENYAVHEKAQKLHDQLTKEATYKLGELYFDQKDYPNARQTWEKYIAQFPNGSHWSLAQEGIINIEYYQGEDYIEAKDYQKAEETWHKFLATFPLDKRAPQVLYTFGEIKRQEAIAKNYDKELLLLAIAEWKKLISKYPQSNETTEAIFQSAKIYEEHLYNVEEALQLYESISSNKPDARQCATNIKQEKLWITTERAFRTDEKAFIKLHSRNIEEFTIKIYKLDMESYFRKEHSISGVENLDVALIEADKTWQYMVPDYQVYLSYENNIEIEMENSGVFVVQVSHKEATATTLLIRSDLEIISKISQKQILVFAQDARQNIPHRDTHILVSNGSQIFLQGKTDTNGIFSHTTDEIKNPNQIQVFAHCENGIASTTLYAQNLKYNPGLTPKAYIFTERSHYNPGDMVNVYAIFRDVVNGCYTIPEITEKYNMTITQNNRVLSYQEFNFSEFGTWQMYYQIPRDSEAVGEYCIVITDAKNRSFQSGFQVEHFQPSLVKLSIDFDKKVVTRGEKVAVTFCARYYYGQPLSNKTIQYYLPNVADSFRTTTNDYGMATIEYDTSSLEITYQYLNFRAHLLEEDVSVNENILLTNQEFYLFLYSSPKKNFAGDSLELTLSVSNILEQKPEVSVAVNVYKKIEKHVDPVLLHLPWKKKVEDSYSEVKITEKNVVVKNKETFHFSLEDKGTYIIRATCKDRFGNTVSEELLTQIFGLDDDPLRIICTKPQLKINETTTCQIRSRLQPCLALVTFERDEIIKHDVISLQTGDNEIPFASTSEYFPNFTLVVATACNQKLHLAQQKFKVESNMKISLNFDKDSYTPGESAKVDIVTQDSNGTPVIAELTLALVDEAFFRLYPSKRSNIIDFFQQDIIDKTIIETSSSIDFSYEGCAAFLDRPRNPSRSRRPKESRRSRHNNNDDFDNNFDDESDEEYDICDMGFSANMCSDESSDAYTTETDMSKISWAGKAITNQEGKSPMQIPIPHQATTWVLIALGCDTGNLFGETTTKITSEKEFFIDARIPSIVMEKDSLEVLVTLHNSSDYRGEVELKLEFISSENGKVVQNCKLEIDAEIKTYIFDAIDIPYAEHANITIFASAGDHKDSCAQYVLIRPFGMVQQTVRSGNITKNESVHLELPDYDYRHLQMEINIASHNLFLLEILERSHFDLAAQELIAMLAVLQHENFSGLSGIVLKQKAKDLTEKLLFHYHQGWKHPNYKWILKSEKHIEYTATCLWALILALKQGLLKYDGIIQNAISFLQGQFARINDEDSKAFIQYVFSLLNKSDFSYINRLYRQRHQTSVIGLSWAIMLMVNSDRENLAQEMADILIKKLETCHCQESLSFAALAAQYIPKNSQKVWDIVSSKLVNFDSYLGIYALALYHHQTKFIDNNCMLDILVNDKQVTTLQVAGEHPKKCLRLPDEFIANHKTKVHFSLRGKGNIFYYINFKGIAKDFRQDIETNLSKNIFHYGLYYENKHIGIKSSTVVSQLELGQMVEVKITHDEHEQNLVIEDYLISGMVLVKDSIRINEQEAKGKWQLEGDNIKFFLTQPNTISYQLIAFVPGEYHSLPPKIYSLDSQQEKLGKISQIRILKPGEKSPDPYTMNTNELFSLGKYYFEAQRFEQAKQYLIQIDAQFKNYETEINRMLLWIYTHDNFYHANKVIQHFEFLHEKNPKFSIPFDKILKIGKAYCDIKEFERAYIVFYAVVESTFNEETRVAKAFEQQKEFLASFQFIEDLWKQYHDSNMVIQAYFGLSQRIYESIETLEQFANNMELKNLQIQEQPVKRNQIADRVIAIIHRFLLMYSDDPTTDAATFSLASIYLEENHFEKLLFISQKGQTLYQKSLYFSSFQYMEALGYYYQGLYETAAEKAKMVADGESKDKNYARYILGQILHANGSFEEAIEHYKMIATEFSDAKDSVTYFERRFLKMKEINVLSPNDIKKLNIQYCNIKELEILVYRVDLMTLYLKHRNLSDITKVRLSGITPAMSKTVSLGIGKDYEEKQTKIELNMEKNGAYLVICRGDDLFTSGLVLISDLELDVQEDTSGKIRTYVRDMKSHKLLKNVEIKTIGSQNDTFFSGETDLRGLFIADGIAGIATVIARDSNNQYAFYQGKQLLAIETNINQTNMNYNESLALMDSRKEKSKSHTKGKSDLKSNLEMQKRKMRKDYSQRLEDNWEHKGDEFEIDQLMF